MTIILYNTNKKSEIIVPKILLPAPKCILPFMNKIKNHIKNNFV